MEKQQDAMQQYLQEIGKKPLLTAEEEQELGRLIREGSEAEAKKARNTLVEANLRLVVFFAKRYLGNGMDLEDLNAMGIEGLIHAAEKYDFTKGNKFSTYASWWINQAISRGIMDEYLPVRIPVHMSEKIRKIRTVQGMLRAKTGEEATVSLLAEATGLSEKEIEEAFQFMYSVGSLDVPVGEDGETTLGMLLPDGGQPDPYSTVEEMDRKEAVSQLLQMLPEREALILSLRYGLGGEEPKTLEEIGKRPEFGVSRERVRQIEEKTMRKIRRSPRMRRLLKEYVA